ncbi:MAG: MBL fold metallo-hydrolase [Chloroflexi bacterium]|nr:MBL fold metallo-hydrolase [Chloroflexota bacterium]
MKITVWGSRGSIASAGPETVRYGGNTACVSVESDDAICILDAGSGLRRAGLVFTGDARPIHLLLTHLHMDHIQGLGFFRPLFESGRTIHLWGPPSTTQDLRTRLTRYLSPPLFPVRIRDFGADVELHDAPVESWLADGFEIHAAALIHPGPTLGYRISAGGRSVAYLSDHEPALGGPLIRTRWISGFDLAVRADVLFHDGQYTTDEYRQRVGWGHSSVEQAVAFADLAGAARLVLFHHEPDHDDTMVDDMLEQARSARQNGSADAAREGLVIDL